MISGVIEYFTPLHKSRALKAHPSATPFIFRPYTPPKTNMTGWKIHHE